MYLLRKKRVYAIVYINRSIDNTFILIQICNYFKTLSGFINLSAPTLQNGQTHSNNSSAVADELFECV